MAILKKFRPMAGMICSVKRRINQSYKLMDVLRLDETLKGKRMLKFGSILWR